MPQVNNSLFTDADRLDILKVNPTTVHIYNTSNTFIANFRNEQIVVSSHSYEYGNRDNVVLTTNPELKARSIDVYSLNIQQGTQLVIDGDLFTVNSIVDEVKSGFSVMSITYV